MKKEIVRKWVKALRSGKYKKGVGQLRDAQKNGKYVYCCLGVLNEEFKLGCVPDSGGLSPKVSTSIGLSEVDQATLINLNDGGWDSDGNKIKPKPFSYIASYLERLFLNDELKKKTKKRK